MVARLLIVLCLTAGLAASAFAAEPATQPADESEAVLATMKIFADAMSGRNPENLAIVLSAETDAQKHVVKSVTRIVIAVAAFRESSKKKWGATAVQAYHMGFDTALLPKEMKFDLVNAEVVIKGNQATVTGEHGQAAQSAHLRKTEQGWVLPVAEMVPVTVKDPAQVATNCAVIEKAADVMEKTRQQIDAGVFWNPKEAAVVAGLRVQDVLGMK